MVLSFLTVQASGVAMFLLIVADVLNFTHHFGGSFENVNTEILSKSNWIGREG